MGYEVQRFCVDTTFENDHGKTNREQSNCFFFRGGPEITELTINSENEIEITFSGTIGVSLLCGIIEGLNEADEDAIIDGSIGWDELYENILFGEHFDSPDAVFTPKIVFDPGHSMIKSALKNQKILVEASESYRRFSVLKESERDENFDFRQSVLKAIGSKGDLKRANNNFHLWGKCTALSYVKGHIIDSIKVFHSEGDTYEAKISDGSSIENDEGIMRWVVPLHVNVTSVASLGLSIYAMEQNGAGIWTMGYI